MRYFYTVEVVLTREWNYRSHYPIRQHDGGLDFCQVCTKTEIQETELPYVIAKALTLYGNSIHDISILCEYKQ
jgi:hypothetical protein